jgi:phospholipid/cholesterol/gamma-HCH transport system substrate-binding protein
MRTKIRAHWARLRVFFTIVVAACILFTLIYLLAGGSLFRTKVYLYSYFEDSGGINTDVNVMYNGVKIGRVNSVRLSHLNDPQRAVVVRMQIDQRFLDRIPNDSKSEIVTANFLGDKFIQINRGQSTVPVQAGAVLAHKPATNVYVRIDLTTFAAQLRLIDTTLRDIQLGKGGIGEFVMTDTLYQHLLAGIKEIEKELGAAAGTKSSLGSFLYGQELYNKARSTLQQIDKTLAGLQAGRGASGKLLRDSSQYDDLRKSMESIRRQMAQIRGSEFMKSDAAYQLWKSGLASISHGVDEFSTSPLLTDQAPYESMLGATQELGNAIRDFRTNPKKYLRLKLF